MKNIINGSCTPETLESLERRIKALRESQKHEEIEQGHSLPERTGQWHTIDYRIDELESLMWEIDTIGEKRYRIYFRCMNASNVSEVRNCIADYLVKIEGGKMTSTDTLYIKTMADHLVKMANEYAARQCNLLAERLQKE